MKDVVLKEIVQNASTLTSQNKLKWSSSTNNMDFFTSKIGDQKLEIFNSGIRYIFQISDLDNNILGSLTEEGYLVTGLYNLTSSVLTSMNSVGLPNFQATYGLKNLFELAKTSVVDVDKRLYELLDKMKKM